MARRTHPIVTALSEATPEQASILHRLLSRYVGTIESTYEDAAPEAAELPTLRPLLARLDGVKAWLKAHPICKNCMTEGKLRPDGFCSELCKLRHADLG